MEDTGFIQSIRLQNILSYGPDTRALSLGPLNVLIGPNASGKSNLIEALSLLAAAPRDLQEPIRNGGGAHDWLWKGATSTPTATIDVSIEYPRTPMALRYRLSFTEVGGRFHLMDEVVEDETITAPYDEEPVFYYHYRDGRPTLSTVMTTTETYRYERQLTLEEVKPEQSILSQRRDPYYYPELTYLANQFERVNFYREWTLGHSTVVRRPQKTDLRQDVLLSDASNLALVLSELRRKPPLKERILELMKDVYPSFNGFDIHVSGSGAQISFQEQGLYEDVPATRLSDGSLRYLCLLAVLCNPTPGWITCIEEPELGLHPDIIPKVADLLVEASERSQIFVTTHSDVLVDALTEVPEAVVVCEKVDGATQLRRLDADKLKPWLEKYRLGELWTSGEIGGNRW